MATFCYEDPTTKQIHLRNFPCGKAPEAIILCDGVECKRSRKAEYRSQHTRPAGNWPVKSHALAVHPSQRKQYREFAGEHGVPTDFDGQGKPVFVNKGHRRKYCELVGAKDLDAGYGDPT